MNQIIQTNIREAEHMARHQAAREAAAARQRVHDIAVGIYCHLAAQVLRDPALTDHQAIGQALNEAADQASAAALVMAPRIGISIKQGPPPG